MATNYKVLGQAAPGAATDTTLYGCPSATQAVISTITVANRGSTAATFRIAVRPDGATIANEHYIAYDILISPTSSYTWTIGVTLDANDVVTVRSSTANLSFSAFGSEVS